MVLDSEKMLQGKMMEEVKYLCEFFFGNFWHLVGLVLVIGATRGINFHYHNKNDKEDKNGKQKDNTV